VDRGAVSRLLRSGADPALLPDRRFSLAVEAAEAARFVGRVAAGAQSFCYRGINAAL